MMYQHGRPRAQRKRGTLRTQTMLHTINVYWDHLNQRILGHPLPVPQVQSMITLALMNVYLSVAKRVIGLLLESGTVGVIAVIRLTTISTDKPEVVIVKDGMLA